MNHQDLINTCIFEQIQGLLFSDLSGPLRVYRPSWRNVGDIVLTFIILYLHLGNFHHLNKSQNFKTVA